MTSVLDKHLGRANTFFPPLAKQLSENARMTDFFCQRAWNACLRESVHSWNKWKKVHRPSFHFLRHIHFPDFHLILSLSLSRPAPTEIPVYNCCLDETKWVVCSLRLEIGDLSQNLFSTSFFFFSNTGERSKNLEKTIDANNWCDDINDELVNASYCTSKNRKRVAEIARMKKYDI